MMKFVDLCASGRFSDFLTNAQEEVKKRMLARDDVSQRISEIKKYNNIIKKSNMSEVKTDDVRN